MRVVEDDKVCFPIFVEEKISRKLMTVESSKAKYKIKKKNK
jgi:hypothetical protein